MKERLDKLLASQGMHSRKEVRGWIRGGGVQVDGERVCDSAFLCDPAVSTITLWGHPVQYTPHVYLMMNKPAGVLSASRDARTPTAVDLVPASLRRPGIAPAGRLDKDVTGFLLLTDDGDFVHRVISPRRHVAKVYIATLDAPAGEDAAAAFASGILLPDGTRCRPAALTPLAENGAPAAHITLYEGRYHQVKLMCAAIGRRVLALRRIAIGGVMLDESLPPGACRPLSGDEYRRILAELS